MKKKVNNDFWQDERFVRNRLLSDEESTAYWETYLKEYPDNQELYEEACHDFEKIQLNNYSLSEEKQKELLDKVYRSHNAQKKKQKQHNLYLYGALVAACLIGVLFLIPVYMSHNSSVGQDSLTILPVSDTVHTEVTLITDRAETIEIEDNAIIAYDSTVYVQNAKGQKNYLSESKVDPKEKMVYNTLVVPRGKRSSLQLPDGSKVWVNAGSVLRFPSTFASEKRMIQVQGEIYIEVVRDESKPFYVQTPKFTVNVLGTSFNVSAYSDEELQSVVLVKGQVAVKTEMNEEIKLIPNQKLEMNDHKNKVVPVDVYDYTSWKDGILQFKGETVAEVLKRLSRYYNVEIKCDPSVAGRRCGGELILFDDVNQVMKSLSLLYEFTYRFESETIIIE